MTRHIPWFNPREMDDATVLALATGRDALLETFLSEVRERHAHPSAGGHWLVTGTRGSGKSYFLRLAESRGKAFYEGKKVRFVLLPEELPNLRSPHDLLDEIRRMLRVAQGATGRAAQWSTAEPGQAWAESLKQLLDSLNEDLLVIGIENFHEVIETAFATEQSASLLRKLLENEPRLLFLVTAIDGSFDEDYNKRLFKQFKHHALAPWDSAAHRQYLTLRAAILGRKPTPRQLAQIDAYSRYTGGNARVAAVLAAALLDDQNLTNASSDLNATLDEMTDYYRELHRRMPANTRNLFDALVRGGEPCSQTQLAERVGARQNDITKAFAWMIDANYLITEKIPGQKNKRYKVADRLFVQWYRMRYLEPGQRSRLAVMAELLAETVAFGDKWRYAQQFLSEGQNDDALLMSDLGFKDRGVQLGLLKAQGLGVSELVELGLRMYERDIEHRVNKGVNSLEYSLWLLEKFPSDAALKAEIQSAYQIASACNRFDKSVTGAELANLTRGSLSLSATEKLRIYLEMPRPNFSQFQWSKLEKVFQDEREEFLKLEPTEGDIIRGLRARLVLESDFPWTETWSQLSEMSGVIKNQAPKFSDIDWLACSAASAAAAYSALNYDEKWKSKAKTAHENAMNYFWEMMWKLNNYELALQGLELLLKINSGKEFALNRARILARITHALTKLDRIDEALVNAQESVVLAREGGDTDLLLFCLCRLGWALGDKTDWPAAMKAHEEALEQISNNKNKARTWHVGQIARYMVHTSGIEVAWDYLQKETKTFIDEQAISALQEMGDCIWDVQRTQSDLSAYAIARQLISKIVGQNRLHHVDSIRALFIDWIETGVNFDLLADLAADLPQTITDGKNLKTIAAVEVFAIWLKDLKLTTTERTLARQQQDPDLVTTLDALNESLSTKTRVRLGLMEQPRLSPEGESIFRRICAFIR